MDLTKIKTSSQAVVVRKLILPKLTSKYETIPPKEMSFYVKDWRMDISRSLINYLKKKIWLKKVWCLAWLEKLWELERHIGSRRKKRIPKSLLRKVKVKLLGHSTNKWLKWMKMEILYIESVIISIMIWLVKRLNIRVSLKNEPAEKMMNLNISNNRMHLIVTKK